MNKFNFLKRYPERKNELLQAWDSADELLIEHVSTLDLKNKRILIINDLFGALTCNLNEFDITTYTDSYVSARGIELNNASTPIRVATTLSFSGIYDYILLKLPNNLSFFEDQLCHLTAHLASHSKIICAGMIKHMAGGAFDLIEKYIGKATTSLAQKKARLIFADFQKNKTESPYPLKVSIENFLHPFINHSNLFSREKLDIGTRFFLEHIPKGEFKTILDLGCANGIIGIKAKMLNPNAKIIFSDDSQMAIQSAKQNYQNYFSDSNAEFIWTNCFENQEKESLDLVLCNPPFHQHHSVGDHVAWQMFNDACFALKIGGRMRVIGNSHLQYQIKLKKIFGNSKIIATNKKFIVVEAVKN